MKYQSSNKKMVQLLVDKCCNFGIKHVVVSPGSRNAPLIISFDNHPEFTCYAITDERSAGFYALGMARQLNEPVALICTSGTAVLNYAPALTEAFYQEIPLIAITADRPPELIDQEDGQTIRQHNIFSNHIRYSTTLPVVESLNNLKDASLLIDSAFSKALSFPNGPIHINIPFEEPMYETCQIEYKGSNIQSFSYNSKINANHKKQVTEVWGNSENILLLCGVMVADKELNKLILKLKKEKNIIVIAPPTSNISEKAAITTAETLFLSIKEEEIKELKPDLLLTIGGPVVSKATKQFLRENKPQYHFDIDVNTTLIDTYKSLTEKITTDTKTFINFLLEDCDVKNSNYCKLWEQKQVEADKTLNTFLKLNNWCDLSVYKTFFEHLNTKINLHLGNSTPVRYAELFPKHNDINYLCNRGTSGIDGCTSTAAGVALVSGQTTFLIVGDISFFYDSNAFWNNHIPKNLKIILINNNGGNIFKIIPGPDTTNQLNKFFVTQQTAKAEKICEAFNINYLQADNEIQFVEKLKILFKTDSCSVLEVFTPSNESATVFKNLIALLKNQ